MNNSTEEQWGVISDVIKFRMLRTGKMSQAELARRAGVGREAMNNYLNGKREMPVQVFMKVAEALGVTPQWIFEEAERILEEDQ